MTRNELELAIGRVVLEKGPNAIVVADGSCRIRYVNNRFTELTGWSEDESVGRLLEEFSRGDTSGVWDRLRNGMEWRGELEAVTRSGGAYWESASIIPVRGSDGRTALILKVSEDITERKRAEEDLRAARDVAERAVAARGEFLANMSHEIRTPIHAIIGNTELLLTTRLNEEQKDYSQTVRLSADVLLTLINDILDVSKIESGKLDLENIGFDVCGVAEEAVELVALQAHRKGLEIVTFFPNSLPHLVTGDPLRLRQIIVNLLNNAVKFTEKGEIFLSVDLESEEEDSALMKFTVKDTGIGIPEDRISGLFKPFSQLDTSTSRRFGGTGLGLAICRRLAELMGGGIGVESRVGEGSAFRFTARLLKQAPSSSYSAIPPDFFDGLNVLLVDDNEASRAALGNYMRSWGCALMEAADGPRALEIMRGRAGTPDAFRVALVDLRLPGMDGWQLASEVNADPTVNAARLVLLTPFGLSAEEAKMKLLKWFDAYITKPVKKSQLLETLFRVAQMEADLESADDAEEVDAEEILEVPKSTAPVRVLIAEDNETNRQLFTALLTRMGHAYGIATNGAEAVEMARGGGFDIVFMDVQMPVMNGLEAARALRAAGNRTPIVAVTASATREEERRCKECGMDGFLMKPFRMQDLAEEMARRLPGAVETAVPGPAAPEQILRSQEYILDFPTLAAVFMGDDRLASGVLTRFLESVRSRLPELSEALALGDYKGLGIEVHGIKGGAMNVRARELAEAAAELERAVSMVDSEASRRKLEEFTQAFGRLTAFAVKGGFAS